MDKVKVSRATQSLVSKGLVRQSQDPRDGRGRLLRLTRKGVTTHAGMVPLVEQLEATLFGDLTRADLAGLLTDKGENFFLAGEGDLLGMMFSQ